MNGVVEMVVQPHSSTEWVRSSYCADASCVEVARIGAAIGLRDSKDPDSPVLLFTATEWEAFRAGVLAGEFRFA
jgi:hypothetical protein